MGGNYEEVYYFNFLFNSLVRDQFAFANNTGISNATAAASIYQRAVFCGIYFSSQYLYLSRGKQS
jgi:hypothetical protein